MEEAPPSPLTTKEALARVEKFVTVPIDEVTTDYILGDLVKEPSDRILFVTPADRVLIRPKMHRDKIDQLNQEGKGAPLAPYGGPLAKTLRYEVGRYHREFIMFAEPQTIRDGAGQPREGCRIYHIPSERWFAPHMNSKALLAFDLPGFTTRPILAEMFACTFIFPYPPPDATVPSLLNEYHQCLSEEEERGEEEKMRRGIVRWMSRGHEDRRTDNHHRFRIIANHRTRIHGFAGISDAADYFNFKVRDIEDALDEQRPHEGWSFRYDVLYPKDGERWDDIEEDYVPEKPPRGKRPKGKTRDALLLTGKKKISSFGRVGSVLANDLGMIECIPLVNDVDGRLYLLLDTYDSETKSAGKRREYVDRLVMESFWDGGEDEEFKFKSGYDIGHINDRVQDNDIENLEFVRHKMHGICENKPIRVTQWLGDRIPGGGGTKAPQSYLFACMYEACKFLGFQDESQLKNHIQNPKPREINTKFRHPKYNIEWVDPGPLSEEEEAVRDEMRRIKRERKRIRDERNKEMIRIRNAEELPQDTEARMKWIRGYEEEEE